MNRYRPQSKSIFNLSAVKSVVPYLGLEKRLSEDMVMHMVVSMVMEPDGGTTTVHHSTTLP